MKLKKNLNQNKTQNMKQKIFFNIQYALFLLIALTMPINNFFFPKLFVLLIATWFLEFDFKTKFKLIKENQLVVPLLMFCGFYLLYVIGMFYSTNIKFGTEDLILKAPIFLMPLIAFSQDLSKWTSRHRILILLAFVIGCFIIFCITTIHSITLCVLNGFDFFYFEEPIWWHHSYLAMYYCFAVAILSIVLIKYPEIPLYQKILTFCLIIIFVVDIVLIASKSGYLTLFIILIIFLLYSLFNKNIKRFTSIYFIVFLGFFFLTFFILPQNRMITSLEVINNYIDIKKNPITIDTLKCTTVKTPDTIIKKVPIQIHDDKESTFARLQTWKNCYELACEHLPFGTGTGDIRDDLTEKHHQKKLTKSYNLNAHCQYLQVVATLGIPGILFFLGCFIVSIVIAFRKKQLLFLIFIFIIGFNFLVESMLEIQAGVSFYAIFNSLLLIFATISFRENKSIKW